jgi:hypothetical protein
VAERGLNMQINGKASLFTVILGWAMSIFIIMAAVAIIIVLITNEDRTPVGLYGYHCYSFFRGCDTRICFEASPNVTSGNYDPLDSLYNWKMCDLDSTVKIEAQACQFDTSLYTLTGGNLGFDICKDEFEGGVYVFEDTFEYWEDKYDFETNLLKSAIWNSTYNAQTSNYCGTGEHLGGERSLSFSGPNYRYAETKNVDVIFGGFVEAELFLAPVGFDVSHPLYVLLHITNIYICTIIIFTL